MQGLGFSGLFSNPKPEGLLRRIIEMATNEHDIVLDFFGGSGTTAAVAHKLNRQYILVEQMNYIHDLTETRLKKVILGEQGGISKAINWKGGGNFIYLELAKHNAYAQNMIENCETLIDLLQLFDVLYNKYFLHYNINIRKFKEIISKETTFINLPLAIQKAMFCQMLDLNQLYVHVSEMEDIQYGLSDADINLTREFYDLRKI
jgi:adenine-specific DNA-methyltransferase